MQDLILLCESCHKQFHKKKIWKNGKKSKYMRDPEYDKNTITYFPERRAFENSLRQKGIE
jgi:5-methylcytosine-specific restriction endonuclease McrA